MKLAIFLFLVVLIGFLAYVRLAPSDPDFWHVDPLNAKKGRKKNVFIQRPDEGKYPSPEFTLDVQTLAQRFDDFALADENVSRLAGSPKEGFVTYVARSQMMRYPDYISVRFIDLGQGRATTAIYSRARFGYSDRGVNRRRAMGWLKALAAQL